MKNKTYRRRLVGLPVVPMVSPASTSDLADDCQVLTIGHSTRPIEDFVALLVAHDVTQLVDVRTVPRSRHNSQYNADVLPASLDAAGITYIHVPALGGFRRTHAPSPNEGWRNPSFRGYADYMLTTKFVEALLDLIGTAQRDRVVLMCAEAVPWRCHRSLIADALLVRGVASCEIVGAKRLQPHRLTPFAEVHGVTITYPAVRGPGITPVMIGS